MDTKRKSDSVRRLKRMIVVTLIIVILIPNIWCIILLSRVKNLERQVDDLFEAKLEQEVEMSMMFDAYSNSSKDYVVQEDKTTSASVDMNVQGEDSTIEKAIPEPETLYAEMTLPEHTKKIYLTFDDGPSSQTNQILDILQEYDVKATFFVIGKKGKEWEPVYKRIVEEGHTLAMHSYTHKYAEIYSSLEAFEEDVENLQDYLFEVTGQKCTFYRFPGGSSNTVSKVPIDQLIAYLNSQGITYFDWNVTAKDATGNFVSADMIVDNCMNGINKHNTCVVLMHDAAGKETTIEALPKLIEEIQTMDDAVLLPISEGTSLVQHR